MKKQKESEIKADSKETFKKKKSYTWLIYIIVLVAVIITCLCTFMYLKNVENDKKSQREKELTIINNQIKEIKDQNEGSLKDYQTDMEFMDSMNYLDLKNNILNEENLKEGTTIQIFVNDELLNEESIINFNEVKEYFVKIVLLYDFAYKIDNENKTERIENIRDYSINVVDTIFPVINGVKNKSITVGGKLDILSGITATDEKEGNIEVQYEGTVDTKKAGTYKVIIYAVDKNGNRSEKEMTITVKAKTTTTPSTGGSTGGSTGSTTNGCSSAAVLKKRGYKTTDADACEKDKESVAIAKQIANEILAKGYTTDLEKVSAAASKVSEYYFQGTHIESGNDYRTPYGVFVKHEASCAGCTRALILVLELMGYKNLVHANENGWTHQWVILEMDGQKGFADGQVGMVGYGCHMVDDNCTE